MTSIWVSAMKAWNRLIRAAIMTPNAVSVKLSSSSPMSAARLRTAFRA